ncbi:MAG: hypothetical protein K0R18_319 [Bacillales bacterium]|jgi:hypothetical protein|nr:hypothetical protein [Bacillales bacterium]
MERYTNNPMINGIIAAMDEQDAKRTAMVVVETPAAEATKAKVEKAPKEKKLKWFEAEGAFPYQAGDIIEIVAGDILIGRKAQVVKPSAKAEALKCILLHPTTGELQKCTITMDFVKIQPAKAEEAPAAEEEVLNEEAV